MRQLVLRSVVFWRVDRPKSRRFAIVYNSLFCHLIKKTHDTPGQGYPTVTYPPHYYTITSCQKEVSHEVGSGGGPGGGGNNYNLSCNNKVMKVKKIQATFDNNQYTEVTWNSDGTVKSVKIQQQLTSNMTAV